MNQKIRILQRFATGDRVRATISIFYARPEASIDKGELGTVTGVRATISIFYARPEASIDKGELGTVTGLSFRGVDAVVDVRWDVGAQWDKYGSASFATSVDCLEPVQEDHQGKR